MARGRCICISEWVSVVISTQSLTAWQACCLCSASLGFHFFIYLFSIKTLRNQALLNSTANYHNANTALAPSSMSSLYVTNCICHSSHTPTNPPTTSPSARLVSCFVIAAVAPNSGCESFRRWLVCNQKWWHICSERLSPGSPPPYQPSHLNHPQGEAPPSWTLACF